MLHEVGLGQSVDIQQRRRELMALADPKAIPDEKDLPPSISTALVDSLFHNFLRCSREWSCAVLTAVMIAIKTGNPWLWPCAALIVIVGGARSVQMRRYERERLESPLTFERAQWWEPRYKVGADLYAGTLGFWCFAVLIGSNDAVAHMLCTVLTIGYTAASVGRNYGRPSIIQRHIVLACAPMSLGLVLYNDRYYAGLAFLLVLFFIGLKYINLNLHQIFVKALISTEREAAIAAQFDTALNNMPNGFACSAPTGALPLSIPTLPTCCRFPPTWWSAAPAFATW